MDQGIGQWLYKQAWINRGRPALGDKDRRLTYDELDIRTNQLAWAMYDAGIRPKDRVALLAVNSVAFLESLFAVAKLGAIAVPLNYRLAAPEIAFQLADSGARTLVYSTGLADLAQAALRDDRLGTIGTIVIGGDGDDGFETVLSRGSTKPLNSYVSPDDDCIIMYTSGTTGRPKGAVLTHGAVTANNHHTLLMGPGMSRYDVTVTTAPLFHIGGLAVHTLPLLYAGGFNFLLERFDPAEMLETMSREGASIEFLVPAMWAGITRVPNFDDYQLDRMRFALTGGAACPLPVIEFLQDRGWQFLEGFGMTESCANTLLLDAEHATTKRGSVGRPHLHIDAKVVDIDDKDVPVGEIGELVLRGPNLFRGYWGLPEATTEAWRGGWFHSGDLVTLDDDGYFTIIDRKKDMVITGGENVYSTEVEQVLYGHEQVLDVAVIGVPDDKWGELVTAVIVPKEGETIDADQLVAWTRERLAGFKTPKRIEIIDDLPRNATGKVLKRSLRMSYAGSESSVSR